MEFVKLFEIADDHTGGGGIAALPPDLKEVKTRMGRRAAQRSVKKDALTIVEPHSLCSTGNVLLLLSARVETVLNRNTFEMKRPL